MRSRNCTQCGKNKPIGEFRRDDTTRGRRYKSCAPCRERRRHLASQPTTNAARGRYGRRDKGSPTVCADCERELTPNRTILLDGDYLCPPCRKARFIYDDSEAQEAG